MSHKHKTHHKRETHHTQPVHPAQTAAHPAAVLHPMATQDENAGGLLGAIGSSVKILEGFNTAVQAIGSVQALIALFSGAESDTQMIVDAINALTDAVNKGLEKINSTLFAQTDFERWQNFATQLQGWQTTIGNHALSLKQAYQDANSGALMVLTYDSNHIPVAEWCEGTATSTGVLEDLGKIVGNLQSWLTAGGTGAPSPMQLWAELSTTASNAGFSGFAGETLHSLLFAWSQSLYAMVSFGTFVRNGAYRLYLNTPNPDPTYGDLSATLRALGNVQNASTTWGAIGTAFGGYEANTIFADNHFCAIESVDDASDDMKQDIARTDGVENITLFWAAKTEAQPNCYFTNLQLLYYDFPQDTARIWYLQGTPVQIAPDGTQTVLAPMTSLPAGYQHTRDVPFGSYYEYLVNNDFNLRLAVGAGYAPEPATANNNLSNVVTGFQIANLGPCIMIALRFGQMDLSNPTQQAIRQSDSAYYGPTSVANMKQIFMLGEQVQFGDLRNVGTQSTYPLTNASFMQMGNRLALTTRSAWQGYKADMFQPSNLISYPPTK